MPNPDTARNQVRLLRFLRQYMARNHFAPSYEEMRKAMGFGSKSYVFRLVTILEQRGLITKGGLQHGRGGSTGRARSAWSGTSPARTAARACR